MAKLAELRKQAKTLGIGPSTIRLCNTAEELQEVIDEFQGESNGDAPVKASKKHAVKKAAVKKAVAKKKGNSKSASSKSAPAAKSKSGKAKRPTAAKSSKGTDGPSGRNLLDGVDFSADEGWNSRDGSAPDRIIRALKRFKGNRSKVFDFLVDDVWGFVGKKKRDGSKRTKSDAEAMLRYRIARTAFDFAVRTGQHEPSENRVKYGTGGTGQGVFKPKGNSKAKTTTAKGNSKKSTSKRKASTKKSTAKGASTRKSASKRKGKKASKK